MNAETGKTQSVERALMLLRAFTDERPELRTSELAKLSGLGQSTASRLLTTLESLDYVERDEHSNLYRLGRSVMTLAGVALNQSSVRREARQVAENLSCSLGLGIYVAERVEDHAFYLLSFAGELAPRSYTMVGRRGPLHASALGKALISELSAEEVESMLPELPEFTPHTITEHTFLQEALAEVRHRGYATEVEELAFGRACVAAPIRDRTGEVAAAISIFGPLSAMDLGARESGLAGAVIEAADRISSGLGFVSTAPPRPVRERQQ